uniref:Uncharacterized protein n=1 Tax=Hyaloperonospora arabidopsidis (strain Emoy2) TaxID=559515 RepID=M4B539_HYAAE
MTRKRGTAATLQVQSNVVTPKRVETPSGGPTTLSSVGHLSRRYPDELSEPV